MDYNTLIKNNKDGFYCGIDLSNKKPIYQDIDNDRNEMIMGYCGSGKSFLIKNKIREIYTKTNNDIIVIQEDFDYFYDLLTSYYDESFIKLIDIKINPFEVKQKFVTNEYLNEKINFLLCLISSICDVELTIIQSEHLRKYIQQLYSTYSASKYNKKDTPTITKLLNIIKKDNIMELKEIEQSLSYNLKYLTVYDDIDSLNLESNKRLFVYDTFRVRDLHPSNTAILILNSIWDKILDNYSKNKKTYIIIDSLTTLFNSKISFSVLFNFIRNIRKKNAFIILSVSDINMLNNKPYRDIVNYMTCFKLLKSKINEYAQLFEDGLSKSTLDFLDSCKKGQGIIYSPHEHNDTVLFQYD